LHQKIDTLRKGLFSVWFVVLTLILAVYARAGFFTRYWADDYCFTAPLKAFGFFKAQWHFYFNSSDRFSTLPVIGISEIFGLKAIQFLPGIVIVLWWAGCFVLIRNLFQSLKLNFSRLESGVIAGVIVFLTIFQAPDLYQSLFWRSGLVTYSLPLAMLCYLSALFLHQTKQRTFSKKQIIFWAIGLFLLSVIVGGFSETTTSLQVGLFGLISTYMVYQWYKNDRTKPTSSIFAVSILVGSIAAMIIMFISPGNERRFAVLPAPPALPTLISLSFKYAWDFIFQTIKGLPIPSAFAFLISAAFLFLNIEKEAAVKLRKSAFVSYPLILLAGYLLLVCICAPSVYAESAFPEDRAMIAGRFVLTTSLVYSGGIVGLGLRSYIEKKTLLVISNVGALLIGIVMLVYPIRGAIQHIGVTQFYRSRAVEWDQRHLDILEQVDSGKVSLEVKAMDSFSHLADLHPDENFWVNRCMADFYEVDSISGIDR
jgi:hypothetical protein